jgi:hypothetical protein
MLYTIIYSLKISLIADKLTQGDDKSEGIARGCCPCPNAHPKDMDHREHRNPGITT